MYTGAWRGEILFTLIPHHCDGQYFMMLKQGAIHERISESDRGQAC